MSRISPFTFILKSRLLVKLTQYTLLPQAVAYPFSWKSLLNYCLVVSMSSSGESIIKLSYLVKMGISVDFLSSLGQGSWSTKWNNLAWSTVSRSVRLAMYMMPCRAMFSRPSCYRITSRSVKRLSIRSRPGMSRMPKRICLPSTECVMPE